jgi:hypothetical protein
VLFGSKLNNSPPFTGIAFHSGFLLPTLAYCCWNISGLMLAVITWLTSSCVGQMSRR